MKKFFYNKLIKIFLVLFFAFSFELAFLIYRDSQITPEERQVKIDEEAQFHCASSSWDGSVRDVVNAVKNNLRDPSSFEHIETKISPVLSDDKQIVTMKYRAKNGFGGMNVESVVVLIKHSNCSVLEIEN
jgi:hypothetical protein